MKESDVAVRDEGGEMTLQDCADRYAAACQKVDDVTRERNDAYIEVEKKFTPRLMDAIDAKEAAQRRLAQAEREARTT